MTFARPPDGKDHKTLKNEMANYDGIYKAGAESGSR